MPITPDEVRSLCDRWLQTVLSRGTPAQQALFGDAAPDRARGIGRFYWQAEYADRRPQSNVIRAMAGIDCIVERVASDELKFVLYISSFHQLLPDSAPLSLESK